MTYLLKRKRFPESITQFYAASVLVAFEELHTKLIAYRDLKVSPGNNLLVICVSTLSHRLSARECSS